MTVVGWDKNDGQSDDGRNSLTSSRLVSVLSLSLSLSLFLSARRIRAKWTVRGYFRKWRRRGPTTRKTNELDVTAQFCSRVREVADEATVVVP